MLARPRHIRAALLIMLCLCSGASGDMGPLHRPPIPDLIVSAKGMVSALKAAVPVSVISLDGQVRPFHRQTPNRAHVVSPGWDDDERRDGALQRYARCREALVDGDLSAIPSGMSLEEWFEEIESGLALLQNSSPDLQANTGRPSFRTEFFTRIGMRTTGRIRGAAPCSSYTE